MRNSVKVHYLSPDVPHLKDVNNNSDWVDVYVARAQVNGKDIPWDSMGEIHYYAGDIIQTWLGFALQPGPNTEADLRPRSSTFRKTGLLQTNSCGVIDNKYAGDNDEWGQQFYAVRSGKISKHQRLGQFRFFAKQEPVIFEACETLGNPDRGGYGSTGK